MTVSGSAGSGTGTASSNGLMVLGMKDSGKIIELMEKVNSLILMVIFMMAIGSMTKLMDMVFIIT